MDRMLEACSIVTMTTTLKLTFFANHAVFLGQKL